MPIRGAGQFTRIGGGLSFDGRFVGFWGAWGDESRTRRLRLMARAGAGEDYEDFIYWNYSGAPPGAGESEGCGKPPRFRSAAFVSVSERAGATFRVAFHGRRAGSTPVNGIYLAEALGASRASTTTLLETGWAGTLLDPQAVDPGSRETLPIMGLALEREAFRNGWLAVTASMGTEEAGWAGIYLADLRGRRPIR